jgi:CDP-diacylglycerol---glycerol-3-phosphate 3-phosphatidyltransferase
MRKIPNLLTIFRIALIPVFLWWVFFSQDTDRIAWALFVFTIAAFTDFLDGYLARKWKAISNFGKIADPLADKLLVLSALAGLTWLEPYRLNILIFLLIAAREAVVTILREIYRRQGVIIPADKLGKIKTVLQMVGVVLFYSLWTWLKPLPDVLIVLANIWFSVVALLTLYSGLNYFRPNKKSDREES